MAEIINFPKLKVGQIVKLEINGEIIKCKVLKHEGKNLYKIKALQGKYKGYTAHFVLKEMDGIKLV